jgi:hypothetical protein
MSRSRIAILSSAVVVTAGVLAGAGILLLDSARAAVGPLPAEALVLPADARFVSGVDVKRLISSPLYQRYAPAGARPEAFSDLESKLGIDPARDVDHVFIAGSGPQDKNGVVVVLGRFDRARLGQAIETSHKGKVTWKTHQGSTVYLFGEGMRGAQALTFLDDTTLVLGTAAAVESAIASRAQGSGGLRGNAELIRLIEQVKPGSAFWVVGDQTLLSNLPRTVPMPQAGGGAGTAMTLPNLKSLTLTGDVDPALRLAITGETTDEAAAKNLGDMVRGFAGMLNLYANEKPELRQLASAISVTVEGNRVLVNANVPYEMLDALQPKKAVARD